MSETYPPGLIADVLRSARTIAVVGASANPQRPSSFVIADLAKKGYDVVPINPGRAGSTIMGLPCFATLADVPRPIDMVDVFRRAEAVPAVLDEALALAPRPQVLWLQLGIVHMEAAERARAAGMVVIQDRCPKIEFGRLSGESGRMGIASGIVSARRRVAGRRMQSLGLPRG